jgi:hypothetical protein
MWALSFKYFNTISCFSFRINAMTILISEQYDRKHIYSFSILYYLSLFKERNIHVISVCFVWRPLLVSRYVKVKETWNVWIFLYTFCFHYDSWSLLECSVSFSVTVTFTVRCKFCQRLFTKAAILSHTHYSLCVLPCINKDTVLTIKLH